MIYSFEYVCVYMYMCVGVQMCLNVCLHWLSLLNKLEYTPEKEDLSSDIGYGIITALTAIR